MISARDGLENKSEVEFDPRIAQYILSKKTIVSISLITVNE